MPQLPAPSGVDLPDLLLPIAGGLLLLVLLMRIPFIGAAIRLLFSVALIAFLVLIVVQRAPMDPVLSDFAGRLGLDRQEVVGKEVRIAMSPSGHFIANVSLNGVRRRMMIDSGATVTALSASTAAAAGITADPEIVPVILQTGNGMIRADTATVEELRLGNIVARDLKVVVSPSLGDLDLIGMNFLSKLRSWRVEGRTLVLVPHHPQPNRS